MENRLLPAIRDRGHNGRLCTFTMYVYSSTLKLHHLTAGQLLSGQPVRYGKADGMVRPS
jgi:hypothetical protein